MNSDLLGPSQGLGVKLSQAFERALVEELRSIRRAQWLERNAEAMAAYNTHIEEDGVFSDELRSF